MKRNIFIIATFLLGLLLIPFNRVDAQTDSVVRAVLFYSPTCPHCERVINESLPPLIQKYGNQLQIIGVNVTQPQGQTLFLAALDEFKLEQGVVPFLVIGDKYLVGDIDIPNQLPGLIEAYLIQGGVDFPDIPGLREALAESKVPAQKNTPTAESAPLETSVQESAPTVAPVSSEESAPPAFALPENPVELTWQQKFAQDPSGNTLAVLVLAGMICAVIYTVSQFQQRKMEAGKSSWNWNWLIPILCAIGFGVAGYLAYVEMTQVKAVCGPVGDCNTVQQSEYARLFGILPIGVLGLAGYVAILLAWLVARYAKGSTADLATLSIFGMAVFGAFFSIYLTFLEPFVIGATCAWCLTSAILITVLMLLSTSPAKVAFFKLKFSISSR